MTGHATDNDETDPDSSARADELTYERDPAESVSEAVVRATAAATGTSVLDLDPLHNTIDPDHLDGVFASSGRDAAASERSVAFSYHGCQVTVTAETVIVRAGGPPE